MLWSVSADNIGAVIASGAIDHLVGDSDGRFQAKPFINFWHMLVLSGFGCVVLATEDNGETISGAMGMVIAPDPNNGVMACNLGFWSVDRDASFRIPIAMFRLFEKWGEQNGAKKLRPAKCLETIKDMDGFFLRQGYRVEEVRYVKDI